MESPPIGSKMGSTAHQSQPLQARSSNSGTSFKKSDVSQSSYQGNGEISTEQQIAWAKNNAQNQPAHGHLTTAFSQMGQQATMKPSHVSRKSGLRNQGPPSVMSHSINASQVCSTATSRARSNSNNTERHPANSQSTKDVNLVPGNASSTRKVTEISSLNDGGKKSGAQTRNVAKRQSAG